MSFAKVVLGLPIEGTFDYLIPKEIEAMVKIGIRCCVPLRNKRMIGYIVDISQKTQVKEVRSLYNIIDETPILGDDILRLSKEVSKYYLCSWGEAIETALPASLRTVKAINIERVYLTKDKEPKKLKPQITLIHDLKGDGRWQIYLQRIKEKAVANQGVIFLSPEIHSAIEVQKKLKYNLNQDVAILHSQQNVKESLLEWRRIKNSQIMIVAGTRQAIFSPIYNLGLIIVDNEDDKSYKQDQTPHYNARDVAFMRAKLSKADLLLGSATPSLEMFNLAKKKKIEYIFIEKKELPEIKIIDARKELFHKRKKNIFAFSLQNIVTESIEKKEKIIFFLNRKGFATYAICPKCGMVISCPYCNANLVYHFKENKLACHYCNYKTNVLELCPNCNSSYIRYSGIGIEKIESELSRLYPKAKIFIVDKDSKNNVHDVDVLISTSFIFRYRPINFDLIIVASIDNSLNRTDFRAAEKTFSILIQLINLGTKRLIIQTALPNHYCFDSIKKLDIFSFYSEELKFRKQLDLPPFSHIALIKLRSRIQERVRNQSQSLFDRLSKSNRDKATKVISCFSLHPSKLRGSFYWQILIKTKNIHKLLDLLKKNLKDYRRGGIIVTVDIDPL